MSKSNKASPQMQSLYDAVLVNARKVIYGTSPTDDQRFGMIVQRMKGAREAIGGSIGQTAATILANVQGAMAKKGTQVPDAVMLAAGRELVTELIMIAQSAKLIPEGKQTAIEQQAITAGVQTFKRAQAAVVAAPQGIVGQAAAQPAQPQSAGA